MVRKQKPELKQLLRQKLKEAAASKEKKKQKKAAGTGKKYGESVVKLGNFI
jgi:hypothetical protein